jgi:hypothetical protein
MKSAQRGKHTSDVEVTNVSRNGFWILLRERELFVPFAEFPFFREAPIGRLLDVAQPHPGHLYWPQLDVDLAVDSIEHPDRYPLVSHGATRVADKPKNEGGGR